ncbi:MAG TPA: sigma 54-interacting transcriptional regulator [Polyangiaceae bacterium]|jgi:MoxR-like ATPase
MNEERSDFEEREGRAETVECVRPLARGPWRLDIGAPCEAASSVLRVGDVLTLGSGRGAALVVHDPAVSGLHCRLTTLAAGVAVEDLNSKNGVFVGGARVRSAVLSEDGASFVIGRSIVSLRPFGCDDELEPCDPLPGVVGSSDPMLRVARLVRRHARQRVPILLQGESGTGKDVVARAIHELGRRGAPFVPLNVAALPDSLADAELFGHRRGAFTGAVASRNGAFEQAHGGTLFLDEIADLHSGIQVKLLRVVEDGSVRPLGATQPVQVDVRLVSASWAVLEERVAQGRFRADLYHRLSTVVVELPPLRQRRSDIAPLAQCLLRRMRAELGEKVLSSAALSRLSAYAWPGNVRELAAVLYRAAAATRELEIAARHVDDANRGAQGRVLEPGEEAHALLARHQGNVSRAARAAGVPRSTFRSWLARGEPSERAD